jgi:ankyrin repeat protein
VKVLVAKGADVNTATIAPKINWQTEPNAGRNPPPRFVAASPLLVAAQNGHADIMKVLVAAGAKKDWKGDDRGNVVLAAAIGGSTDALDYAIELQPDLTVANETGQTVTHLVLSNRKAQVRGHLSPETPDMVRLLGRKGAPLLAKNDRGQTPESSTRNAAPEIIAAFADAKQLAGIKTETADTGKRVAQ